MTFEELYQHLLQNAVTGVDEPLRAEDVNPHQLDCLLHPETCAPVWRINDCKCNEAAPACSAAVTNRSRRSA